MRSRYLTNIVLAVMAGFLVVASQAFAPPVLSWLMLGIGVGTIAIVVPAALALRRRGILQRGLDGIVGVLGAWTIVAGLVFSGAAVTWLGFSAAVAIVGLAVIGLTAHELSTERVVHSLEIHAGARDADRPLAEARS